MNGQTFSPRYHALDSLRAIMMLLGIVIHVACGYGTLKDTWWFQDSRTTPFFDYCLVLIHVFRMPIFFAMAGFFAALLYTKRGTVAFLRNRASRILLPLALGMVTIYPALKIMQRFARGWTAERTLTWIKTGGLIRYIEPTHFWFLYYLVLIYTLTAIFLLATRGVQVSWTERWFRAVMRSQWAPVVFSVPTFGCLLLMRFGLIDTPHSFLPKPLIVAFYGIFFGFGWMLYLSIDLLPTLQRFARWNTTAATVMLLANLVCLFRQNPAKPNGDVSALIGTASTGALAVWLLVFGLTGLFLRHLDRPIRAMRYLSDSAYWMFVFHPIPVLSLNILLSGLAWSPFLKAAVNLTATTVVLLVTYQFCVRSTWVGVLLNGKRYGSKEIRSRERSAPALVRLLQLNQKNSEEAV